MKMTENEYILELNPEFYDIECALEVEKEFKQFNIQVEISNVIQLKVLKDQENSKQILYEFANYLLQFMKIRGLV